MSEGDTYPLPDSAEMWRKRALQAEADLRDECNRHGEILFIVEAENARLRKEVGTAPPEYGDPLGQETYKQRCERITKEFPDTMRAIIEAALQWGLVNPQRIYDRESQVDYIQRGLAAFMVKK